MAPPVSRLRLLFFFCLSVAASWAQHPVTAQGQPSEYQVKAAFLYHFAKFVEWPVSRLEKPGFVVCLIGEDPFGADLEKILGNKMINDQAILIERIAKPEAIAGCHLLFVSRSEFGRLGEVVTVSRRNHVLTVGETAAFTEGGGIVAFVLEENKVRFAVNQRSSLKSGLKISSKLLRLGLKVED